MFARVANPSRDSLLSYLDFRCYYFERDTSFSDVDYIWNCIMVAHRPADRKRIRRESYSELKVTSN